MSIQKVRSAIAQAFVTGAFFPAPAVAWENVDFTPPNDAPWASFFFVPSQPAVATCGPDGQDEVPGFAQIDLNYPLNGGTQDIESKFEDIRNVFTAGARFVYQGQEVVIRSCGRSQGRVVNSFYRVSITVAFYAHINR